VREVPFARIHLSTVRYCVWCHTEIDRRLYHRSSPTVEKHVAPHRRNGQRHVGAQLEGARLEGVARPRFAPPA